MRSLNTLSLIGASVQHVPSPSMSRSLHGGNPVASGHVTTSHDLREIGHTNT